MSDLPCSIELLRPYDARKLVSVPYYQERKNHASSRQIDRTANAQLRPGKFIPERPGNDIRIDDF